MIRIAALLGFLLTLLCPVFCLADVDDCCAETSRPGVETCQAMAVGAVVAPQAKAKPPCPSSAIADLFASDHARLFLPLGLPWLASRVQAVPHPLSAADRRVMLQSFLF